MIYSYVYKMKYPIGIQNFPSLRRDGYVYVDKTGYIRKLVDSGRYYFLSRPRRFGKSLLLSTIEAYFRGERELFHGLKIAERETEWETYPVFHLDLSGENYKDAATLYQGINYFLDGVDREFGIITSGEPTPSLRLKSAIRQVSEQRRKPVVVLIDEYDTPLTQTIDRPELQEEFRAILKGFYGVLKSMDGNIKFAMLTGVTRFSKVSIFSDLNNLRDISFTPEYNAICGISETELSQYFTETTEEFAAQTGSTIAEIRRQLRSNYDGYRFADPAVTEGIYNPFSLLNALVTRSIGDYWFETGTPTYLVSLLRMRDYRLADLSHAEATQEDLAGLDFTMGDVVPLMYQSGYLTIRAYDKDFRVYTLGFPNNEVENGFLRFLFPYYTSAAQGNTAFAIRRFILDLNVGNVNGFMTRLQSLFADFPYDQIRDIELHYHNVLYLVFTLMGYYTRTEYRTSRGRADLVVATSDTVYIFEFKLDRTPEEALEQINSRDYPLPFKTDGRRIVKIGVNFSTLTRNIDGWIAE